jgi:glycerol transport system permease protein
MKTRVIWFLLPALLLMSVSAFLPVMTVLNYSLHVLFAGSIPKYIGLENYKAAMHTDPFVKAIGRQFIYTLEILLIEVPLGLALALTLPKKGIFVGLVLVLLGIPLLIPWNVVGIIWRLFIRADIGVLPEAFKRIGVAYSVEKAHPAWWTVITMDVWHWTPLVTLLCYAGLRAIPQEFYQAARVDSASKFATFRYVTLPKLKHVLIIAILLRSMDSFKVYSEPFILTAGGPGTTTELLSLFVSRQAIGAFNLGLSSAFSLIYFIIVLVMCYVLYVTMTQIGERR